MSLQYPASRTTFLSSQRSEEEKRQLNTLLRDTASEIQITQESKTDALDLWQSKVEKIIQTVSSNDNRFECEKWYTGSSYEGLKVKEADEFDLVLKLKGLKLGAGPSYATKTNTTGCGKRPPTGYMKVLIDKRKKGRWNRQGGRWVNRRGSLKAVNVKSVFARRVKCAIQELGYQRDIPEEPFLGPAAVTVQFKKDASTSCSVDMTLAIQDSVSWPDEAAEWLTRRRQGWPNKVLIDSIQEDGCLLIAKQPNVSTGNDHPFLWHYSFTLAEKRLFREGDHGVADSCRKNVLRIMKALRETPSLKLKPLMSYHLKTIMLYESESKPNPRQWSSDQIWNRFYDAMKSLRECLQRKSCPHYFMKDINLFQEMEDCESLARRVTDILNNPYNNIICCVDTCCPSTSAQAPAHKKNPQINRVHTGNWCPL